MSITKKTILLTGLAFFSSQSYASNWLMLQGTEPANTSVRAKVWGFVQPEYQSMSGTELPAGGFSGQPMSPNLVKPDNKSKSAFNIRRARVGVRGTGFPLDSDVNYFFLAEFGNNGITAPADVGVLVSDASITFNQLPGARFRVGQFKTPGSEEGLQAIHVFNYVNFTSVTDQMLLERFTDGDGTDTQSANAPNGSVSAFRDIGLQVFDTFKVDNWEHSYALMLGNGNGIGRSDNDDNKETYIYWSSELVYGGKGGRRDGLKLFAWNQSGKRTLTAAGAGEYDRDRNGLGMTFRKGKYRAAAEYITADGMIFNGSDGGAVPGSRNNADTTTASINVLTDDKSDGYYIDFGYKVIPKLELDFRYDVLNRATETATGERQFDTLTVGAQYFFNKKSRVTFNYEFRNQEAPGFADTATPNLIADALDDRLSLQWLVIF